MACFVTNFFVLEWFYYAYVRRMIYWLSSLIAALFSLVFLLSQFTTAVFDITGYNYSPFFIGLKYLASFEMRTLLQVYSLGIVLVMSAILFFSLYHFTVQYKYHVVAHHADSISLLYLATVACRVIPTLCYNYLQILGVNDECNNIAYLNVMGLLHLQELQKLGRAFYYFADYFPLFMLFIAMCTLVNIWPTVGKCLQLKFQLFHFLDAPLGTSSATIEQIRKGKALISRAKQKRMRHAMLSPNSSNTTDLAQADDALLLASYAQPSTTLYGAVNV